MLRRFLLLLLFLLAPCARAQTPIALYESFAGNVDFAGTQRTIRTGSNQTNPCGVEGANTNLSATLAGIPAGATIQRAHLYWAGSGAADYSVRFQGRTVSADPARSYTATVNGLSYFGGAADVTSLVTGAGTYTFSRLSVDASTAYCQVEGVTGGFALLVVYSDASLPFRVLNVYEGFQPTYYSNVALSLSNFKIPDPIGTATARIGHITWEGDSTLGDTNAENLFFNDTELFDAINPRYNQFNSSSNINNDPGSFGIDFDAYTVAAPVIQAGQTSATTRYQSGQDLVLLHSEVVAVPNVPVSDLSIAMTAANSTMTQGVANSYTITVANAGPNPEPGPVVVSDTIHADLTITSVTGTGWACTVNGQQVNCSQNGPVAAGTVLSPITISVTPRNNPGEIVNVAAVSGRNFDNNAANSSASVTTSGSASNYVFTDRPCAHGVAFGNAQQPCKRYPFVTVTAGAQLTDIYITSLNGFGVPTRLANNAATSVSFYFGVSCINPAANAGVVPVFSAQASMALCASGGLKPSGTQNAVITFPSGSPSSNAGYSFQYQDVGLIELYMVGANNRTGSSGAFVSKPARIVLSSIARTAAPSLPNPAAASATAPRFVAAGEPFSMTVAALSSTGATTPNFGREMVPESFSIAVGAAHDPATPGVPFADMQEIPAISGAWGAIVGGAASGSAFSWPEVGILRVTPGITSGNYLGQGPVTGETVNIGRFHPHHFNTTIDAPFQPCIAATACPSTVGDAYSGQPFEVEASARNAADQVTLNYRGKFAHAVTLDAWSAAGGTTSAQPSGSKLENAATNPATIPVIPAGAFAAGSATLAQVRYTFPTAYSSASPDQSSDWVAPTTIYLRASETDDADASDGVIGDAVSSRRTSGSAEGAVRIVSGRLLVSHRLASSALPVPVPLKTQYWSGSAWDTSSGDDASSIVAVQSNLLFSDCLGAFAATCSAALAPESSTTVAFAQGGATLRLAAPGAGKSGAVRLQVGAAAWLPSTAGRLIFGQRPGKLDYIREVY